MIDERRSSEAAGRQGRSPGRWGTRLGVGLVTLAAGIVAYDLIAEPPAPSWEPVRRTSALDSAASSPAAERPGCDGLPRRWMVFGWDGAAWDTVLPLMAEGRLPHLAELVADGAHGNLYGFQPSLSPALWTTVATGYSPDRHGITGFDKRRHRLRRRLERVLGLGRVDRALHSNADRRSPALWNHLTDAARRSLVVGYHNTYPADSIEGLLVSNYLVQAHMREIRQANRPVDEAFGRSLVHPAEAIDDVLAAERRLRERLADGLTRFVRLGPARLDEVVAARELPEDRELRRLYALRQAWLFDTFHAELALEALPRVEPDLLLLHLQGIDLVSHYFLYHDRPRAFDEMDWGEATRAELDAEVPRYAAAVREFYVYLDELLGRFLEHRDPETVVLVVSDHGFDPEPDPRRGGYHDDAPPGMLVLQGPGIKSGVRVDASIYDVFPTLMSGLGLPVARDLPGAVLSAAFCPGTLEQLAPVSVESYPEADGYVPAIAAPAELTDAIERELRALGYLR